MFLSIFVLGPTRLVHGQEWIERGNYEFINTRATSRQPVPISSTPWDGSSFILPYVLSRTCPPSQARKGISFFFLVVALVD